MERILVIGSPGSGKSTFSRALAQRKQLPLVYLARQNRLHAKHCLQNSCHEPCQRTRRHRHCKAQIRMPRGGTRRTGNQPQRE